MDSIKNNMLRYENTYSKYATFDKEALRLDKIIPDIRPNYFRDIDRIIHSSAYTRYIDKTQVFSNIVNDNIQKRIIHVQLVSKIARTIGRALKLNEDLIESIALGHDLGHVPFGHIGESILNNISIKNNEGIFMHNVQSVRTLMNVENKGYGLNITVQVLDGILCHNGEKLLNKYCYKKKNINDFLNDYNNCYKGKIYSNIVPMSLEACVVRISDIIAYIGRDIDDANVLGKLNKKIPLNISKVLGSTNREIINNIILDIINNSLDKNYISLSNKIFNAMNELIKYNYDNIYLLANSNEQIKEYELMFNVVFDKLIYILSNNLHEFNVYKNFLNDMSDDYKSNTSSRIALDYIAGMTDDYFIKEYNILKSI